MSPFRALASADRDAAVASSVTRAVDAAHVWEAVDGAGTATWSVEPESCRSRGVAAEFGLHELAVEDAVLAHQRPKLERYGYTLFVVLRAPRYPDRQEAVEFAELPAFIVPDFAVTVRHGEGSDLRRVRRRAGEEPDILSRGSEAILYAILDRVVDDHGPVVRGLENDIDEIETEVFGGNAGVTRPTCVLAREVIEFRRAAKPLGRDADRPDRRR